MSTYEDIVWRLRVLCKKTVHYDKESVGNDARELLASMVKMLYKGTGYSYNVNRTMRQNIERLSLCKVNEETISCLLSIAELIKSREYGKAIHMLKSMLYDLTVYSRKGVA